ncbi:MAG: DUF4338 domain-containing protein [Gammaproteobacteria bacterium]|nr:DUF4338 domain-containing protein [Gammaproteobacteria bacterium]
MTLDAVFVRPIQESEVAKYDTLMQVHHYLGSLRPVGETLRYVAVYQTQWIALISFSSAALKCAARDRWIGWSYRHQFDRLNLVTNNSRFLILPEWHVPNLASRLLSLCQRRLADDWVKHFGHPLLLLETFVDPKLIFVYPLQRSTRRLMSQSLLPSRYHCGAPNLMLTAEQMKSLPEVFKTIDDPRRPQGQRHRLSSILAICAGAVLCGRVGYKGIWQWANSLSQDARRRFFCYYKQGVFYVPSEYVIRDTLIRVSPDALDQALNRWSERYALEDESLAIDGKTMRGAIDNEGKQTHFMSAVGHQSLLCYGQKKSANYA